MSFLLTSLHALSTSTKYVLLLLLALNAHSLPFVWHVRFWWRLLPRAWVVKTRGRQTYLDQCEGSIRSLGGVSAKTISRRRAWFDDCDYNMHLSNSCYAKSVDHANSKWLWQNMPAFHEAGGYSALGGTHYTFIKEIPILSSYTIETRLVGWGDKWYYLVNEFVIYPKPKKGRSKSLDAHTPGALTPPSTATKSGDSTPVQAAAAPLDLASHAAAALRTPKKRDDGGVVACIAVHELCMKVGRITVPPRIGFYLAGHASSPNDRSRARSLASDRKTASAWLAGGWKAEENAADLGRDIEPYQTSDAKDEKSSGSVVQAQMDRVVKGMAGVAVGLCELTSV